ncbi:MAG: hypothetical protein JJE13_05930 [Thermoleophilia bacterium]|nr:hypothetical protein [Thermoleophilia bacterium]
MRTTLAMTFASAVLLLGCSETEVDTPDVCLESPASITAALRNAPEPVALDGGTVISDCLVRNQSEGDLVNFGTNITEVATGLGGDVSRPGPAGVKAAIDAGYLVGAIEKGAEDSDGIHATLVERVKSAATNGLSRASELKRAHYQAGYEAGSKSG